MGLSASNTDLICISHCHATTPAVGVDTTENPAWHRQVQMWLGVAQTKRWCGLKYAEKNNPTASIWRNLRQQHEFMLYEHLVIFGHSFSSSREDLMERHTSSSHHSLSDAVRIMMQSERGSIKSLQHHRVNIVSYLVEWEEAREGCS